jgi:hypothetical protein
VAPVASTANSMLYTESVTAAGLVTCPGSIQAVPVAVTTLVSKVPLPVRPCSQVRWPSTVSGSPLSSATLVLPVLPTN